MPLSQADQQAAYRNAEQQYASSHPNCRNSAEMEADPEFRRMLREEEAHIENQRAREAAAQQQRAQAAQSQRSDSAVAGCPLQQPAQTATVACNFSDLSLSKQGDSNRVYRRSSIGSQPHVLELVAGRNRALTTIEARVTGVVGPCTTHAHHVWDISPAVSGTDLSNNSQLTARLGWRGDVDTLGFFNQNVSPTVYRISANTHNSRDTVEVRVYPDYAWEGTATVAFRVEEGTRAIRYDGLSIQIQRTDDNVTTQFGGRIQEIVDLLARFLSFVFQVKDIAQRVTAGACAWSLVPPSFAITIGSRWQENLRTLRCGYYYSLRFAFSPLIGIQFTANLGIIAIQAIPYIGRLVAQMAADEITRYIAVTFTIQGTLGVDVTASKSAEAGSGTITGGLTGQIQFDFQIRGQINRDFSFFAINCGLRAGARASVTGTVRGPMIDRSGSYVSLGANFDGLTLYVATYCRAGSSQTTSQATPGRGIQGGYTGQDGSYQVTDRGHQLTGETNREQAGGAGETSYLWIEATPLGEGRINL